MSLVRPEAETELYVGLVGAVGTDLGAAARALTDVFRGLEYEVCDVKMSNLIREVRAGSDTFTDYESWPEHRRIKEHMDAGDSIREQVEDGGALAATAMALVRETRKADVLKRRVFIFNSLKHPGEIKLLRSTYGERFFVVSVFEHRDQREQALTKKLERSYATAPTGDGPNSEQAAGELARALMLRDEEGLGRTYGQSVRKAFAEADLFLRTGERLEPALKRFVHLIFGHPHITPTWQELAMMGARNVALRSADLSRQVGAVIVDPTGDAVMATGCNEVPKAGGGAYWAGDVPDRRDFVEGVDRSAKAKRDIQAELLVRLRKKGWLNEELLPGDLDRAELYQRAESAQLWDGTRASNLLEFGRIVHAEMASLMDAARRGIAVQGMTLVCTTFPCHMCARHIVAAGVAKVLYIEPYPKSMAGELYPGAIRVDGSGDADQGAAEFEPFEGISPNRFGSLFSMPKRKDRSGYALTWEPDGSRRPKIKMGRAAYLEIESAICNDFAKALKPKVEMT